LKRVWPTLAHWGETTTPMPLFKIAPVSFGHHASVKMGGPDARALESRAIGAKGAAAARTGRISTLSGPGAAGCPAVWDMCPALWKVELIRGWGERNCGKVHSTSLITLGVKQVVRSRSSLAGVTWVVRTVCGP
jgi:hypothetical protein